MKRLILVLVIFILTCGYAGAETLNADSVVCKDLKSIIKLNDTIGNNDYTFMIHAINNNLCRRVNNSAQVDVVETYDQFSKIKGVSIPQMPYPFYWTYTQYLD